MEKKTYAVIDLETTGSSFRKGHRIFQFGCTVIENNKVIQDYNIMINPERSIPAVVEKLTGVQSKDVRDAPYFDEVAPYIHQLLQNSVIVAHNIHFDYHFLNESFRETGLPPLDLPGMDTVELTKILYPTLDSYRLSDLSSFFALEHPAAHDAASDARATAFLFLHLQQKARQLPLVTLEKLVALAGHCLMENHLFFEDSLTFAKEQRLPLASGIYIKKGMALRDKNPAAEQTPYRLKEDMDYTRFSKKKLMDSLGYQYREVQNTLMDTLYHFFHEDQEEDQLAIEAAPGLGKTLAYLLPLVFVASPKKKVVISTSTLLLQEQLLEKELGSLAAIVPFPVKAAALVSKNHLLHLSKFHQLELDQLSKKEALVTMSLYVWLTETTTGNLDDLSNGHYVETLWEKIRYSEGDPVLEDDWKEDDFYRFHQQEAKEASIIITNHSYLCHHLEDVAGLVPEVKPWLLLDEAHQIPHAFRASMQVKTDISRMKRRINRMAGEVRNYREGLQPVDDGHLYELYNQEFALGQLAAGLDDLEQHLYSLWRDKKNNEKENEIYFSHSELFDLDNRRVLRQLLRSITDCIYTSQRLIEKESAKAAFPFFLKINSLIPRLQSAQDSIHKIMESERSFYFTLSYHVENEAASLQWSRYLLDPGEVFQQKISHNFEKVCYLSGTLALEENSRYFGRLVGRETLPVLRFPYPFAIDERMRVYVPLELQPLQNLNHAALTDQIVRSIQKIAEALDTKVLVLFNSNELLESVQEELKRINFTEATGVEVLTQGYSGSRRRMHQRFLTARNAVLMGSLSYWEGIDFPNQPIKLLIITRLPFDPPNRPEIQAIQSLRSSAFQQELLPRTMMRLKQGIGRIVRKEQDRGVVICLDDRLIHSSYAGKLQKILPEKVTVQTASFVEILSETASFLGK